MCVCSFMTHTVVGSVFFFPLGIFFSVSYHLQFFFGFPLENIIFLSHHFCKLVGNGGETYLWVGKSGCAKGIHSKFPTNFPTNSPTDFPHVFPTDFPTDFSTTFATDFSTTFCTDVCAHFSTYLYADFSTDICADYTNLIFTVEIKSCKGRIHTDYCCLVVEKQQCQHS